MATPCLTPRLGTLYASYLPVQGASEDAIQAELAAAASPEDPQPLTEEELEERTQLLDEGFKDWSRRDFSAFVRACTKYGRNALSDVAREVEGKTEEEVRRLAGLQHIAVCGAVRCPEAE